VISLYLFPTTGSLSRYRSTRYAPGGSKSNTVSFFPASLLETSENNHAGSVDDAKITQTTRKTKYPYKICKGIHLLKDFLGLSKVIEAWSTRPHHPMSSTFEQHADGLPLTSQDIVGKKKSRVKFLCMLCRGIHQTHILPHMDEASKLLEDMNISQPQLPVSYHKFTLDSPVVDGMINPVPSWVSPVDQVVNLVTSLVEPFEKVINPIPSSVNPTLPIESATQEVDPFPPIDPILPLENETQVVDLISSSVDPTLSLERKPDTAHVFLVDTDTTVPGAFLLLLWNPLQVMRPYFLIGMH
jgi:hypothetical protein